MQNKDKEEKNIPPEANKNIILFHIKKNDINKFENSLKTILSNFQKFEEKDKKVLISDICSEIRNLIDNQKIKFFQILIKYLKEFGIITEEYFNIGVELCQLYCDSKRYDEAHNLLNILINDANNYEDKKTTENILIQLNDMMKNILQIKDELSKELNNKKVNNKSKKNKKKNKKNKYKDLDYNIEEYDEEKEQKERDEILKLIKESFSLTNDEMNELINFYLDDDKYDIDEIVSILLNRFYKNKDEDEEEDEKEISNENKINEEKNKLDIVKISNLRDLFYSLKFDKNDDNSSIEDKKTEIKKKKLSNLSNFDLKATNEFLKQNENSNKIDLHGKTLIQSMYIIENKIKSLKEKKIYDNLREIKLEIITGKGDHSQGKKAVLKPNLTIWLKRIKRRKQLTVESKSGEGYIIITIH